LPEKHNFDAPVRDEATDFIQNLLRCPADLPSAYIWYDAVTAEIVAAVHDVDARFEEVLSSDRKTFREDLGLLADVDDSLVLVQGSDEEFRKRI
jgi:hypothetical protein